MEFFTKKDGLQVHNFLLKRNETIAVAESVSAGLLQLAFSQIESASEFYQGGITTYNLGQKYKHLQVEPIHAELNDCVSEKVSTEMALRVCDLFNSQWGIAVTGYATPVPQAGNKLFAHYAIAHNSKIISRGKIIARKQKPFDVQVFYVKKILQVFLSKMKK